MPEKNPNSARPDDASQSTNSTTSPTPRKTPGSTTNIPAKQADQTLADPGQPGSAEADQAVGANGPAQQPTRGTTPAPNKGPSVTPTGGTTNIAGKQADQTLADPGQPGSAEADQAVGANGPAQQPTRGTTPAPRPGPSVTTGPDKRLSVTPVKDEGKPGSAASKGSGKS